MKKVTVWTVILVLALSGAAMAMGHGYRSGAMGIGGQGKHHQWWENDEVTKDLSLSPREVNELDGLYRAHQHRMIDLREDTRKARRDLSDFIESDGFSASGAKDRYRALDKIRSEMGEAMFNYRVKQRVILGNDRYGQLKDTVREHRHERNERRGEHMRGGYAQMHERNNGYGPGRHMD